jgi:DNA-binding transcriptional ArsR family regulator
MVASILQLSHRRRVAAVGREQVHALAEIFKVLADPTRLKILAALADARELCVHELCARLAMSQPAVSHQLRTLRAARLVRGRRAGREIHYALDDEHVVRLISEGLKHAGHGVSP